MLAKGDTLFVLDISSPNLFAYDLQNPANPVLLGQVGLPAGWNGYVWFERMAMLDSATLVVTGYNGVQGELRLVGISDPAQMQIVGGYNVSGSISSLAVRGTALFLGVPDVGVVALTMDPQTYNLFPVDTIQILAGNVDLAGFVLPSGLHMLYASAWYPPSSVSLADTVHLLNAPVATGVSRVAWYLPAVPVRGLQADPRQTSRVLARTSGGFYLLAADPTGVQEGGVDLPVPVRVNVVRGGLRVEAPVGRLEVYDGMGRRVLRRQVAGRTVLPLRPGLYFWTYRTDDRKVGGKVLVLP